MGRKAQRTSPYPEELKGENDGVDRISKLPDEIIVQILSLLTVREALSTSVLSHRWRYMWTFVSNLDFDSLKTLHDMELLVRDKHPRVEKYKYVMGENQVLNTHQALTIDRFRVRFDVDRQYGHDIDKWIDFAIQKRVKRLELDLSTCNGRNQYGRHSLQLFPSQLIGSSSYDSLKALQLSSVNVTGEFLECFLSSCPLLERLSVVASESLVNLKVTGPSLRLKHLEISCCFRMEKIEIFAKNLMSLKYSGPNISLPLKNIPQLTELSVGGDYCKFLIDNISQFSSPLTQLETLALDMHQIEKTTDFLHFPILNHLKQLEVKLDARQDESLLGLTSLVKVSPFLDRFTLKLCCWPDIPREVQRELEKAEKCCHKYLKVVEFHGFVGRAIDLELATYFIENAVALEKIIIDRRHQHFPESAWDLKENRRKLSARKHARLLGKKLPRGVTMVML